MVGVMLENLSHTATIARSTISSVYRTSQIAASVYKSSYHQKASSGHAHYCCTAWEVFFSFKNDNVNFLCISQAFPEALFHQLLLAMLHPDNKTRIGSHRVLSTIVAPSLLCPWSAMSFPIPAKGDDLQNLRLLALSAFSSEAIINEMRTKNKIQESLQKNDKSEAIVGPENGYALTEPNTRQYLGSPCLNEHHLTAFNDEVWNPAGISILPCSPFFGIAC